MPRLQQIFVYPVKALDGHLLQEVSVLASGALQWDRRFAIVDQQGNWVNGKRYPKIVTLRARYSDDFRLIHLTHPLRPEEATFTLACDNHELIAYLSDALGQPVRLLENPQSGFPDDQEAPGPTVVSQASLLRVAAWLGRLSSDEVRQRTRPNLVLSGCPPFWEDRLAVGGNVVFSIGPVEFVGMRICRRCIVPTLQPGTAERWPGFEKRFMERRWREKPPWSPLTEERSSYRFAINTRVTSPGHLRVGDAVRILSPEQP